MVKEVDPAISTQDAKPFGKNLIVKNVSKKQRTIEVASNASIEEVVTLVDDLDDTATLSIAQKHAEAIQFVAAIKAKTCAEEAERRRLEAKEEERRKAKRAKEERIAEIGRRLEMRKKEKVEAEKKKKEKEKVDREEVERKKKKEREEKEEVETERKRQEQKVKQQKIAAKASMEALTITSPSIEAVQSGVMTSATSLSSGLGDVDKLLENVSLTLQKCQTPTKTTSAITALKPTQEQLQAAINQLKEVLKHPANMIFHDTVKSLEAELRSWKLKRSQKFLELQSIYIKGQGLIQGMELISKAEQDLQILQSEINNLEMLPLMSWTGLSIAFKEL
uniref:Uncharacterized protein n=1 Tax=Fagus sylvatica TaxID=28930 RepID=A0A2N9G3D1_FAGSY